MTAATPHARLIYMTAKDRAEALTIARVLVQEDLAACVNILGEISSVYVWDGAVCEDGEVAFLAKTRADLVAALTERVQALHSYDCPCVVSLPIDGGAQDFLSWIDATVKKVEA